MIFVKSAMVAQLLDGVGSDNDQMDFRSHRRAPIRKDPPNQANVYSDIRISEKEEEADQGIGRSQMKRKMLWAD